MIETTLQECLKAVIDNRGVTPHKRGTEWQDYGVPVLSANNIKTTGLQKMDEIRFIPDDVYSSWMKMPLEKGDIILTSEAPAGEVFYWDSDEKVVLGQRLYGLKVKDEINSKFLKYYLQSSVGQKAIAQQQSGSTVMGIAASTFPQIVVRLPNRADQDAQADLLYTIDSIISNNNAICSNLEAMAKLLYDYWFVQFDFPDEKGKPYKSSGGKMVWNDELKREIPAGWEVKDILDVCDIVDCLHSKKPDYCYENDDCYLLTLENLTKDGYVDLSNKFYISQSDYDVWTSKIEVSEGDFVVTNAGRAGDIGRIPNGVKCAIGRNLTAIRPTNISSIYLNMFLHSFYVQSQIMSNLDQGSFFASFNVYAIKKLKVLVPDECMMEKALLKFTDIIIQMEACQAENQQLASLRDFLLPMLMNGQVKVGE